MKCDCCQNEKELHPFYYDFFNLEYDENKWGYLCDDCRKVFLKCSSYYNPYIEKDKKPLEDMYELISISVELRKENEKNNNDNHLLTDSDLSKNKIDFKKDWIESYNNLQKLVTIISSRAKSMSEKEISECKLEDFKYDIFELLMEVANKRNFQLNKCQIINLNILLNKKLKEFYTKQELVSEAELTYELAQNYLYRSNNTTEKVKSTKEKTIQALMEHSYNDSYSFNTSVEANETIKSAMSNLQDFEKEFIQLRFGLGCEEMNLKEMQQTYYPEFNLVQLKWIEDELLYQLRENIGVVKRRKKRELYK